MSTLQLYRFFALDALGGVNASDAAQMDLLSDTIRATLHTTTYTPAPTTDKAFADATNELTTALGYTANGKAIAGKTLTASAASIFDMDDTTITWTAAGGSLVFRYVVFHDDTVSTGPPVKPLIGYIDCGAQTITDGNTFTVTTGANGLFTVTTTGA